MESLFKLRWIAGALVFLHIIPAIICWGREGHYTTCKIAEEYLTDEAKAAVKELLQESTNGELANVCSWPDLPEIRELYPWSFALHFVNSPNVCKYDYCRDCHDTAQLMNRCVTGAMYNYTFQLFSAYHNYGAEKIYNLTEALIFLSHFVGDVHQPLHVSFIGDLGGNLINVTWYDKTINLHQVWDRAIITTSLERYYSSNLMNMINALKENITNEWSNEIKLWEACDHTVCPNQYATESMSLACKYAYKDATPGSHLQDEYFLSRLPIVEKRLAEGGIRLATLLNRIFSTQVMKQSSSY